MAIITSIEYDVLVEIFEHACKMSDGRPNDHQAPLNLSLTCRRWREIILEHGCFWTRFTCEDIDRIGLARVWLQRSRNNILDLDLSGTFASGSLLCTIFENQSRLGRLLVEGTRCKGTEPVAISDLSSMSKLKLDRILFMVSASPPPAIDQTPSAARPQPIAPILYELQVTIEEKDMPRSFWAAVDLLEQCPRLNKFSLHIDGHSPSSHNTGGRIFNSYSLNNLAEISLSGQVVGPVQAWLQHTTAPNLRLLDIRNKNNRNSGSALPDSVADFLERSQCCGVEKAWLSIGRSGIQTWERIIQALPGLRMYYSGENFPFHREEYELLTIRNGSGDRWPCLSQFTKVGYPGDTSAVVSFLLSRLRRSQLFCADIEVRHLNEDSRRLLEDHAELSQCRVDLQSGACKTLAWDNLCLKP